MSTAQATQNPEAQALEPSASLSVDGVKEAKWDDHHHDSHGWNDDLRDECGNFGAKASRWAPSFCECPGTTTPSEECHSGGQKDFLRDRLLFEKGCRCMSSAEVSRERSISVRASARKFRTSILEKASEAKGKLDQLKVQAKNIRPNTSLRPKIEAT